MPCLHKKYMNFKFQSVSISGFQVSGKNTVIKFVHCFYICHPLQFGLLTLSRAILASISEV
jgi:hypothetical protein